MAVEHLISATLEGRLDAYTVDLYRRDGTADHGSGLPGEPDLPVELEIADYSGPAGGDMKPNVGGGLMGSEFTATFLDPEGYLEHLFGTFAFEEQAFYVHVTGDDGNGGEMHWWGQPLPVSVEQEQAPEVYPGGEVTVQFRCGIGALEGVEGTKASHPSAAAVLRRLADAAPWPVRVRLGVWPEIGGGIGQAGDYQIDFLAFGAQRGRDVEDNTTIRADDYFSGDNDPSKAKAEDQVANLARFATLSVFLPTDLEEPHWLVIPRAQVGEEIDTASEVDTDGTVTYPVTVDERTLTVVGEWGGGAGERVPRKGRHRLTPAAVRLTSSADLNLVRDPDFANGGGSVYWETVLGAPAVGPNGGLQLAVGNNEQAVLGRFAATPGLRFYVRTRRAYTDITHAGTNPLGDVQIILVGDDGATYYGPNWDTSQQNMVLTYVRQTGRDLSGDANLYIDHEGVTTTDLPSAGTVYAKLLGATDAGFDAEFLFVTVNPAGVGSGAEGGLGVVRTFTASPQVNYAAPATAAEKDLPLPLRPLADGDPAVAWTSDASGGAYGTAHEAAAAERLAQTAGLNGAPLRALVTTIPGLVGPQTLVTLTGSEPFADGVAFVVVGYEMDLKHGLTRVSLCERTTAGLTVEVESLLLESGDDILLESGDLILLE